MLFSSTGAALILAATVQARTPPNSQPSTEGELYVQFPGSPAFKENDLLSKMATSMKPTVALNTTTTPEATYSLLMLDLSLPSSRFPPNVTSTLAPGLGADRTTRLHWFDTSITRGTNNLLTSSNPTANASQIAEYQGPSPPAGDTPHTYVLYLIPGQPQPSDIQRYKESFSASPNNRNNFSLPTFLSESNLQGPVAAQYFRVQVTNGTATTGTGMGEGTSTPAASSTPSTTNAARGSWVDSPTWWAALAGVGALAAFVM